jgi:DNA sulfur modification protein DndD
MILTKLVLSDFGLYGGKHEFDLRPHDTEEEIRPIILFGGKNGSGKTTILEAIRLCLYGRDALGFRISTAEYHAYLRKRTHQTRQRSADRAMIALEFEYMDDQERGSYRIERSWTCHDTDVGEILSVHKDGDLQFGIGPEYWQDILKTLVPLGLSDLFFFDGERIQSLADDERGGPALATALKELLGVNLIEQLETDLRVYLTRQSKTAGLADTHEELEMLQKEQHRLQEDISAYRQDLAGITARRDRALNKIEEKEAEIASQGGIFVEKRSIAEAQKQTLEARMKHVRDSLEDSCADLLPFALAPTIGRALYKQLQKEEQLERELSTQIVLQEQADAIAKEIESESFWTELSPHGVPDELREIVSERIRLLLLSRANEARTTSQGSIIHVLSHQDREELQQALRRSFTSTRKDALSSVQELLKAQMQLEDVERFLQAVPPSELLAPLIHDLHTLHHEASKLNTRLEALAKSIKQTEYELTEVERKIRKIDTLVQQNAKLQVKGILISKVLEVLSNFRKELLRLKISDLEAAFTDYFNRLVRKQEFVSHVIINEQDFSMTLVSRAGRYIAKAQLSAGEKQIYAIALLWALRAVAARPLPVIIDTPLGRLDSSHRQNLVEYYFPNASHQVIILSTDTEIDQSYFTELGPFISHAYHLEYDDAEESTKATSGYFWQSTEDKELVDAS